MFRKRLVLEITVQESIVVELGNTHRSNSSWHDICKFGLFGEALKKDSHDKCLCRILYTMIEGMVCDGGNVV